VILKDVVGWAVCLFLAGLIAAFAAIPARRARRLLFFVICGIGVAVGAYGFVVAYFGAQEQMVRIMEWFGRGEARGTPPVILGYFGLLGVPFSLVIGASLAFVILALDTTFPRQHLRRYVYRGLAAFFVIWIAIATAQEAVLMLRPYTVETDKYIVTRSSKFNLLSLLGHRGSHFLLLAGLLIGAWRTFPKKVFQILFPVASVLTFLTLILTRWTFPRMQLEEVFATNLWLLFWLVAYFYLNVHQHGEQTKSEKIKQIPKVALLLVGVGVLHDFPEYDVLRKLFPSVSLIAERTIIALDLALILMLVWLTLSGQIFGRQVAPSRRR
jgi:hypothetical protein